jgi:twitching motility protein PilT
VIQLKALLQRVIDLNGTDLHLKVGSRPMIRLVGDLEPQDFDVVTEQDAQQVLEETTDEDQRQKFRQNWELDYAVSHSDTFRFRVNVGISLGRMAFSMRLLRNDILSFDELRLPDAIRRLCDVERGLILVTGITGSGKTTTLATMVNMINETRKGHIVTVEDPVEFVHKDKKCIVTQREVGTDTKSFLEALKHALRQDPDVILIGEMRDPETIRTAISAAETGHLVLSTLHTVQAPPTIERILSFFDGPEQTIVRTQLATNLRGVVSQRLLVSRDKTRIIPAVEIMINTGTVRKLMLEGRINELKTAIQNREEDMQTFDQALEDLVRSGQITLEEGMAASDSPLTLRRNVMGGVAGGDRSTIIGGF